MNNLKLIVVFLYFALFGVQFNCTAQNLEAENVQPKNKTNMNLINQFEFQPLPYAFNALEPYIDKQTVEIHYSKHHKAYYDNFLKAISGTDLESMSITDIFGNISKCSAAVRNNSGGYYNHTMYWNNMKAHGGGSPDGKLSMAILKTLCRS